MSRNSFGPESSHRRFLMARSSPVTGWSLSTRSISRSASSDVQLNLISITIANNTLLPEHRLPNTFVGAIQSSQDCCHFRRQISGQFKYRLEFLPNRCSHNMKQLRYFDR